MNHPGIDATLHIGLTLSGSASDQLKFLASHSLPWLVKLIGALSHFGLINLGLNYEKGQKKSKLLFLIQQNFNPAPEYPEKNR